MNQGRTDSKVPASSPAMPANNTSSTSTIQAQLAARRAKRAAKAADRQRRSDALKEEGNAFYRKGDFTAALALYQQAVDVHGPSRKPVLLANLAAAYLKLSMYAEAHDAADRALAADPTSVKARYRRAMARKHMEMWAAADIDLRTLLTLDPTNKAAQAELAFVEEKRSDPQYWEEEDMNSYSDYEAPALEDDPQLGESLSESSDCEHAGNGVPCKFYNNTECKHGRACRFSHAPDSRSERDALGRNVCRYYLMGVCKFGERCSYAHSREYLLQNGWWSTTEWIDRERKRYDLVQMCNKAIADYKNANKAPEASRKQAKGKKRRHRARSGGSRPECMPAKHSDLGSPSQRVGMKGKKKQDYPYSSRYGHGLEDDENGMFGFTGSEVDELLWQGVKPWDEDAWDVLDALHEYY